MTGIYAHMSMPERSFGRTVRYRRTKLGLSQAQLAELVGRSTATIRAWEREKTRPNDSKVITTLSAILGVNERQLFEKADVTPPTRSEDSDETLEQVLAELSPDEGAPEGDPGEDRTEVLTEHSGGEAGMDIEVDSAVEPEIEVDLDEESSAAPSPPPVPETVSVAALSADLGATAASSSAPAFVAPPDSYVTTPLTPSVADVSYMEERSQRQLYRVRTLATIVALVALVVAFLWAVGEGLGALGDWWDEFFGNLRL